MLCFSTSSAASRARRRPASRCAPARRSRSASEGAPAFEREKCVHCGACLWNCAQSPDGERGNIEFVAGGSGGIAFQRRELKLSQPSRKIMPNELSTSLSARGLCPIRCRLWSRRAGRTGPESRMRWCCRRCSIRGQRARSTRPRNLAAKNPGSKVWLVSLGPKAKLQQVMMTVAQKVALRAGSRGRADRRIPGCARDSGGTCRRDRRDSRTRARTSCCCSADGSRRRAARA